MTDPVDFILDLQYENIPENAVESARLCILDAVGCMLGGMENRRVKELARAISQKHPGASKIVSTSLTSARPWAAFINTHACTYFDFDDGHRKAQGHPGGIIVPLALMMAAENDLTGRELLASVVVGYEIAVRSALIMREAGGPRKGSGGWSIIGAVSVAGKLSNFSKDEMKNGLGLAEYYAPQAAQDRSLAFPSSMKEGMAWSAHAAVSITDLTELGFDGMTPSLADSHHCNDLGVNWEICSTYFKMHSCCRFSHPVLDGLTPLIESGMNWKEVKSITVVSFAKAMLLNHLEPLNPVAAMYSIPFIIGCYLVNGRVGVTEMSEKSLGDARILELARKVNLVEDKEMTAQFPLKCLARVLVTLKSGKSFESDVLAAKGDPDNPYSREEIEEKFKQLTRGFTKERRESLFKEITNLDTGNYPNLWQCITL